MEECAAKISLYYRDIILQHLIKTYLADGGVTWKSQLRNLSIVTWSK